MKVVAESSDARTIARAPRSSPHLSAEGIGCSVAPPRRQRNILSLDRAGVSQVEGIRSPCLRTLPREGAPLLSRVTDEWAGVSRSIQDGHACSTCIPGLAWSSDPSLRHSALTYRNLRHGQDRRSCSTILPRVCFGEPRHALAQILH